ncbi:MULTISPECIES: NYN domain-containing protein [Cyanophyceae]|uniref:NYN domain-containing protein n=1 Tax=Cyanophyceae TaxID=3028117 RepID=UPI001682C836|nr:MULTISPECIES: NYN domain-containing protein [Cyanophyceae]MBD1919451.1 NYN domain-containing protein [Phormidium sp. FACHB-77]MBD2054303.1 NYN domain-containing protein [Leptolyngbya sp. FACHB-60]
MLQFLDHFELMVVVVPIGLVTLRQELRISKLLKRIAALPRPVSPQNEMTQQLEPEDRVAVFIDGPNMLGASYEFDVCIHYGALLGLINCRSEYVVRSAFYTPSIVGNAGHDTFVRSLITKGFEVGQPLAGPSKHGKKHPDVDCQLLSDILIHADMFDTCILLSGDIDYLPALRHLRSKGKRIEVWGFHERTACEMRQVAHTFIDLQTLEDVCRPRQQHH